MDVLVRVFMVEAPHSAFGGKNAQLDRAGQQAQARIQELEQENRGLREELTRLRAQQDQISQAILDARSSAEALKAESRAREEAARETIRQALDRELLELARYREKVAALRETIQSTLTGLEQHAEALEQQAEELYEAAPTGNLTLFQ